MTSPRFFEGFEVGMSQEYGDYLVTKEEILEFALNFDPQPFHLSEGVGKAMDFGGLCASGFHTSAIAMRKWTICLLGRPAENEEHDYQQKRITFEARYRYCLYVQRNF